MTESRSFHVLRHAHSSWARLGERDHARPLDDRGRRDVAIMAARIESIARNIDLVICSSAVRGCETLDGIRPGLPTFVDIHISDDLYALGADAYARALREHSQREVLLIGHNPSIEEFARSVCSEGSLEAESILVQGIGTAHWLAIDQLLDGPKGELHGHLRSVIRP